MRQCLPPAGLGWCGGASDYLQQSLDGVDGTKRTSSRSWVVWRNQRLPPAGPGPCGGASRRGPPSPGGSAAAEWSGAAAAGGRGTGAAAGPPAVPARLSPRRPRPLQSRITWPQSAHQWGVTAKLSCDLLTDGAETENYCNNCIPRGGYEGRTLQPAHCIGWKKMMYRDLHVKGYSSVRI